MGYYDYYPEHIPERPIVLTGFFGSDPDQVGAWLAGLTGLTLHDIPRQMEHSAGSSLLRLARDGTNTTALEQTLLERALTAAPPGVVVLGPDSLMTATARAAVADRGCLVVLTLDRIEAYWKLRRDLADQPRRHLPWITQRPERPEDLSVLYRARAPGYAGADLSLPAAGRAPRELATQVGQALALLPA